MSRRFIKMHGLGNDFVIFDARAKPFALSMAQVVQICNRRTGIGCDQLVLMEAPRDEKTAAFLKIYNADGAPVPTCGNASRCVAGLLMAQLGLDRVVIETMGGRLDCVLEDNGNITVNMGMAKIGWQEIPLLEPADTNHIAFNIGELKDGCGVNVGNPHVVFFVPDVEKIPIEKYGPLLENHAKLPLRANISVVQLLYPDRLRVRVWERGVGVTPACGSAACAVAVAAVRRNLYPRRPTHVEMDGGELIVEWRDDGQVMQSGPVSLSFTGEWLPVDALSRVAKNIAAAGAG